MVKEDKKSMIDIKKHFDTDIEKENNGVWVEIAGAKFKIASANLGTNLNYNKKYVEIGKQRHKLEDEEGLKEFLLDTYAETVLLDWSGVEDDGKEFPYSKENAKELLRIPRFWAEITMVSTNIDNYRKAQEEEIEKN